MNGQSFMRILGEAFDPFLREMGFVMETPNISGKLYGVDFCGNSHVVSVSFEPGDNYLLVLIFGRNGGKLSDIDNLTETPRLSDLNRRYMSIISNAGKLENETFFNAIAAKDEDEKRLLKAAKDLRLVLPLHMDSLSLHD